MTTNNSSMFMELLICGDFPILELFCWKRANKNMSNVELPLLVKIPLSLLPALQSGVELTLIEERRVGEKTKRYLQFPDEDERSQTFAGSEVSKQYLNQLRDARMQVCAAMPHVLPTAEASTWPGGHVLGPVVALQASVLEASGKIANGTALRRSYELHRVETECSGIFPLVAETASDGHPMTFAVSGGDENKIDAVQELDGAVLNLEDGIKYFDPADIAQSSIQPTVSARIEDLLGKVQYDLPWKDVCQSYHRVLADGGRGMRLFSVEDLVARLRLTSRSAAKLLSASPQKVRLRCGVYVSACSVTKIFIMWSGADAGVIGPDELNDVEKGNFQRMALKPFDAASEDGQVMWLAQGPKSSDDLSQAISRQCSGACTSRELGQAIALGRDFFCVTAELRGNTYLVLHGPRMKQQLSIDDSIAAELHRTVEELSSRAPNKSATATAHQANTTLYTIRHVTDRVIRVLSQLGGAAPLASVVAHSLLSGVAPEAVSAALKSVASFDRQRRAWVMNTHA